MVPFSKTPTHICGKLKLSSNRINFKTLSSRPEKCMVRGNSTTESQVCDNVLSGLDLLYTPLSVRDISGIVGTGSAMQSQKNLPQFH
jgi:hypothetical protein